MKVVTVEEMRAIEKATDESGVSYDEMMQHAGRAVAEVVMRALGEDAAGRRVAVLVGPGNNGGDGLVAARILREETGAEVGCYLLKARDEDDGVFAAARDAGVFIAVAEDDQRWRVLKNLVSAADVVVDALLGTGARLPVEGELAKLLRAAAGAMRVEAGEADDLLWPAAPVEPTSDGPLVVAVDVPSGLDADTGALDALALPADITVTFAAPKRGQFAHPGADALGELVVAPIGTPPDLEALQAVALEVATGESVRALLPDRPADSHKGTYGRAAIVAGSVNYTGAAILAAEAAYRSGAGLVTLAVPQIVYGVAAAAVREATWLLLPHDMGVLNAAALDVLRDELGEVQAMLLGPGLGQEEPTAEFVSGLFRGRRAAKRGAIGFGAPRGGDPEGDAFEFEAPLVVDADGLNLLANLDEWWALLPDRTVLTPHPGEMARLSGLGRDAIQADRVETARTHAEKWGCVVVLKGAYTVVAGPEGRATLIPFASDALATAGTGDVLAGCIAGLLAQGAAPFDAAVAAAYVHGLAGRIAAEVRPGRGVIAGDVLAALPEAFALIEGF